MLKTFPKKFRTAERDALTTICLLFENGLGLNVEILEEIGSTNAYLKDYAKRGAPHGLVAVAKDQTGGRGRFDRAWVSKPGESLCFSMLLRLNMPTNEAPRLTFVAALAVCEALREIAGVDAMIKWPNDVLIKGKKCCGILLEMCKASAEPDSENAIVIGIGVNVNTEEFPKEFAATSLLLECGRRFPRAQIARAILRKINALLRGLRIEGFQPILQKYNALSCTINQNITVTESGNQTNGKAIAFDDLGFLILETEDGKTKRVSSGNVTLRV